MRLKNACNVPPVPSPAVCPSLLRSALSLTLPRSTGGGHRSGWGTLLLLLALAGCSSTPKQFTEGVTRIAEKQGVVDAKSQRVRCMPCIRMDAALLARIDAVSKQESLADARTEAISILDDAHALALQSAGVEMARLDGSAWSALAKRYYGSDTAGDDVKRILSDEFTRQVKVQFWFLREQAGKAPDLKALREVLADLRKQTEPSIKERGRLGRSAPLAVFALPAMIARETIHSNEAACQSDEPFERSVIYAPADGIPQATVAHWDLLVKHAPVFVQETLEKPEYSPDADRLGRVHAADDGAIGVDVARPAVYAYARTIPLNGRPHIQLTYAIWYPEHPKLKSGVDPEAGRIDGASVRITLDAQNRPATFETLNNCGCHHRIYPSAAMEAAARSDHGKPLQGRDFAVEQDVSGKYDLIIPKTIDAAPGARATVRCRAGTHAVVDVDYSDAAHKDEPVAQRCAYTLLPYDELESLKTPGGQTTSMFLPNGLVRGAERLEGQLFKPLGMLNAGQPRQRGTQMIQWDQYDFDDPTLLQKTMRLPKDF